MSLQYEEPDDDNEVDNIISSEKTNDVNDLTKSPDMSLQYDKP